MFEAVKRWWANRKFFVPTGKAEWVNLISLPTIGFSLGRRKLSATYLRDLYRGWVFSCVNARAQDVGTIEFKLYRLSAEGDVEEELKSHELLDLLYGMNENMTKKDVVELWSKHLDIFGEAYWELNKEKGKERILPLMPNGMIPKYDNDGMIVGWAYSEGGENVAIKKNLETESVIYFKDTDPFNPRKGYSVVEGAYEWIEAEINATDWNRAFFKNNAVPQFALQSKFPAQAANVTRKKEEWKEEHKGVANAHNIGVIPAGLEVVKLAGDMKDMDFGTLDERFQNKILSAFGVPRTRLGITDEVNRANAEATNFVYALRTIKPRMEKLVDSLNEFLVPRYGEDLFLDFVSPVPEDIELELKKIAAGLGTSPYMTVNEVREGQGLEPVEGGDVVFYNFALQALGEVKKAEKGKGGRPVAMGKRMLKKNYMFRREVLDKTKQDIVDGVKKVIDGLDLEGLRHKAFVNRVSKYTKLMESKIKGVNGKLWKEVKENLDTLISENRVLSRITTKDLLSGEGEGLVELVIDVSRPVMFELFEKEAQASLDSLGISEPFKMTDRLRKLLAEKLQNLGDSYSATSIESIRSVISRGIEEGLGIRDIGEKLKEEIAGSVGDGRAEMVADTETFRVANLAIREGMKESGVVETVRWYTAEDERVCQFCAPMNGREISVDDPFFKKGALVRGGEGGVLQLDYDDVWGGALHPRCRCYVRPEKIGGE
jgi:HK97 family phage portal protein